MKKDKVSKPNIFEYTDFRMYLQDYYKAMKKETAYFSFRYFSRTAGFTSPNYLKLIMEGSRNLSADGISRFSKAMKLDVKETRYFRLMVLMNQAATAEEKDFYTRQILKSKVYKTLKPLNEAQYDYYSQWFHIPLRELVGRSDFKNDPKWIAPQFTPHLTETQVKEGLELLEKLQLITKTENNSYTITDHAISTGDEVTSLAVMNYHRKMMQMAAEALDRFPASERDISSLTMGVSRETAKKIKTLVQEFRKEVIALVNHETNVEDVVQLNFQLFPIVKKGEVHE